MSKRIRVWLALLALTVAASGQPITAPNRADIMAARATPARRVVLPNGMTILLNDRQRQIAPCEGWLRIHAHQYTNRSGRISRKIVVAISSIDL